MNRRRLVELIELGEGLHVEFKQRFSTFEKIAKEIIAFANTNGGWLILGVDDDKSLYGIESEKGDAELIKETAEKYCEPPVKYALHNFEIENKEILLVEIPESVNKPHRLQDYLPHIDLNNVSVYVRVNDKSVLAGKEMIKIMQAQTAKMSLRNYEIGDNERIVFEYLEEHETITAKELSQYANISNRRASRTLIKLVRANLLLIHTKDNGGDYFTYAGGS